MVPLLYRTQIVNWPQYDATLFIVKRAWNLYSLYPFIVLDLHHGYKAWTTGGCRPQCTASTYLEQARYCQLCPGWVVFKFLEGKSPSIASSWPPFPKHRLFQVTQSTLQGQNQAFSVMKAKKKKVVNSRILSTETILQSTRDTRVKYCTY